jgi:putative tryptophan/tyrosine transport system substrate-binding protein
MLRALRPCYGTHRKLHALVGLQIHVLNGSTSREIEAAFATLVRDRADALFIGPDGFFGTRRVQFATLAMRHVIPTAYAIREFPEVGGLMSYGTDSWTCFVGRRLHRSSPQCAKPADLPVMQPTKFDLVINLTTAKALGLNVPDKLLALADEVIE